MFSLLVSALAAYAIARLNLKNRQLILTCIVASTMFPLVTLLVPIFETMRTFGLLNSYTALVLPYIVLNLPVCTLVLVSFFQSIPKDLENAAMIDGCTRMGALWRVVVPLAAPGVFTAGILAFVNSWDEFLLALSLEQQPELAHAAGRHHALPGRVHVSVADHLGRADRRHRADRGADRDLPGARGRWPDARRLEGMRSMSKIRYGIIGCGSMGREHIENICARSGGARGDRHRRPARRRAATQRRRCCDGQVQLFERPPGPAEERPVRRAWSSPARTSRTSSVMRDALATDLHILCEKPLVTTMADGVEMIERAKRKRKGIVWVAQEYRYMPPVAEMIRIAHEGGVGTLHQVAIREHREPFYPKVGDWNRFSANTGGTLVEKCCHYFNLMDFILKEKPLRVFASGGQRVNHLDEKYDGKTPDILDSAYVIVEYPSGARAIARPVHVRRELDRQRARRSIVGDRRQARIAAAFGRAALRPARRLGPARGLGPAVGHRPRAWRCARSATPTSNTSASISAPATSSTRSSRTRCATACRRRFRSKKACARWPPAWRRTRASTKGRVVALSRSLACGVVRRWRLLVRMRASSASAQVIA